MTKKVTYIFIFSVFCLSILIFGKKKLSIFFYNRAIYYSEHARLEKAALFLEKSIKLNPSAALVHFALANTYLSLKAEDKALAEYKKSLQLEPDFIKSYKALTYVYLKRHMNRDALNAFKQIRPIDMPAEEFKQLKRRIIVNCVSESVESYFSGDKVNAYDILNRVKDINPDSAYYYYILGYFFYLDGRRSDAVSGLKKAALIEPQFWHSHKLLGDIYFEEGDCLSAINFYKTALKFSPSNVNLYNDLGLALVKVENYVEALLFLKSASNLDPENLNIRYNLANVYKDNNMLDDSLSEFQKLICRQEDFPNAHNEMGNIYKLKGRQKEALKEYNQEIYYLNKKIITDPDNIFFLNNLAYAYGAIGKYGKAEEIIKEVIKKNPRYQQAYLTLSSIQESSGRYEESLITLNTAKSLSQETGFIGKGEQRIREYLSLKENVFNRQNQAKFFLELQRSE